MLTLQNIAIAFAVLSAFAILFYLWVGKRLADDIDKMGDQ